MNRKITGVVACIAVVTLWYFFGNPASSDEASELNESGKDIMEASVVESNFIYGFAENAYHIVEGTIKRNQNLSHILTEYNVNYSVIDQIARKSKDIFDVRKLAVDKKYILICDKDSLNAKYFIYEPNSTEYVVYELEGDLNIQHEIKEIETTVKTISGVIKANSSVYNVMLEEGGTTKLVDDFADIFGWKLDFGTIQKDDYFRVVYEEMRVEGDLIGTGKIISAEMNHWGKPMYAFSYDQGDGEDYFDEEGNSLKKAFLRYPVNFSRISSRYNPKRFHPVAKVYRAHLGTDFAAPTGTPIKAAADGIVEAAAYTSANGNYVKIKHNATYTTGYLHMSKRASGLKAGQRVKQGQVIGYVGSTGLATGPHLCYRFWKNGVQIDALKVDLPPEVPITAEHKAEYEKAMISQRVLLDAIKIKTEKVAIAANKN